MPIRPLHRADAIALLAAGTVDLAAVRAFVRSDTPLAAALEDALATPPPRGRLGSLTSERRAAQCRTRSSSSIYDNAA